LNRKILLGISLLCILIFTVGGVSAQTFTEYSFSLRGTGSFMAHPPRILGQIIGGNPLLYPGTFWIVFDDTGWPTDDPGTPQNERLDYIIAQYFQYDSSAGAESWWGYFTPGNYGEPMPAWRFFSAAGDTLGGSCSEIMITIKDLNANGIMEASEYASKAMSGNMVSYVDYGGGCFNNSCGFGSFSGTLKVVNAGTMEEELYVRSPSYPSGLLYIQDGGCSLGVEESSWGSIKSIYR
jgi:hypothetical protein